MKPKASSAIEVAGARTHNLKNVSCRVPIGAITVVTGPSGSGKSSLAFDTLYAEGQRRFVESMSTYARQFLERMERPDVDRIDHLLPALAIEQKSPGRSARSTVGTATEVHDVLRLLFAAAGTVVCPSCGTEVRRESPESVRESLLGELGEGARVVVVAPRPAEGIRWRFYDTGAALCFVQERRAQLAPARFETHLGLARVVPVEVRLAKERAGQQQRRVHGGQLDPLEARVQGLADPAGRDPPGGVGAAVHRAVHLLHDPEAVVVKLDHEHPPLRTEHPRHLLQHALLRL